MSKLPYFLAAAVVSLAATPALADSGHVPFDGMTEQAISQIVTYAGYDVVDIDLKGHFYRVEAYEPAGRKVKLQVRADDGTILPSSEARQAAQATSN